MQVVMRTELFLERIREQNDVLDVIEEITTGTEWLDQVYWSDNSYKEGAVLMA